MYHDAISELLEEEHPEKSLILIEQQESLLMEENPRETRAIENYVNYSRQSKQRILSQFESIADIAVVMKGKKQLKNPYRIILFNRIGIEYFSVGVDCILDFQRMWWGLRYGPLLATVWLVWVCNYYKHVKYICPECHQEFKPGKKEAFFAKHTPTTRNLTCSECDIKDSVLKFWDGDHMSDLINRSWTKLRFRH